MVSDKRLKQSFQTDQINIMNWNLDMVDAFALNLITMQDISLLCQSNAYDLSGSLFCKCCKPNTDLKYGHRHTYEFRKQPIKNQR